MWTVFMPYFMISSCFFTLYLSFSWVWDILSSQLLSAGMRLPTPSNRAVGAPLFNPAWLYTSSGPVLLQEGEFAMFCQFGISSTFDNGICCSIATDFGSFASVNMAMSSDFISASHLEMLRWTLLGAHQEDWAEINPLVEKNYQGRVKDKHSLVSIDHLLQSALPLVVPLEAAGFFLFPNSFGV